MNTRYAIIDRISAIRVRCNKILPATYGESLSYMEAIAKLAYKVNETIEAVNGLNDNVDALNDSVLNLNTRITNVENTLSSFLDDIEKQFEEITKEYDRKIDAKLGEVDVKLAEVDAELVNVDARVTALEQGIDKRFDELEEKLNRSIHELTILVNEELHVINEMYVKFEADMRDYVEEKIREALSQIPDLTNIYVIDPTTGKLEKVQDVINNIFMFSAHFAFTVDELNELDLTIDETNDIMVKSIPRGMTIYEWLSSAKKILVTQVAPAIAEKFAYPHSFVFDYLSGNKVWHDRNVDVNQQLIASSGCYSCDELVTMAFTCDEIIAFDISYFNYNMRANKLMVRA